MFFMKSFVIFPSICTFILIFTILDVIRFPKKNNYKILLSMGFTAILGTLAVMKIDEVFFLVYHLGFYIMFPTIPALTYIISKRLPNDGSYTYGLRVAVIFLVVAFFVGLTFGATYLLSMLNNAEYPPE